MTEIPQIEEKIKTLSEEWDFIKKNEIIDFSIIYNFILFSLDQLIVTIDNLLESGKIKKIIVLQSIEKIYDHVVKEGLPLWMKPFASSIKYYVVYVLLSSSIDYFVYKYRNKEWVQNTETNEQTLMETLMSKFEYFLDLRTKDDCCESKNIGGIIVKSNEKLEIGDVVSIYDNENDVNLGCFEINDMNISNTNRTKNVAKKYKDCEECLENNKIICKDKKPTATPLPTMPSSNIPSTPSSKFEYFLDLRTKDDCCESKNVGGIIVKSNEKLEIGDVVSIYDNENDVNLGCFEINDMNISNTNRTKNVAKKYKDCEECLENNKIICKDKKPSSTPTMPLPSPTNETNVSSKFEYFLDLRTKDDCCESKNVGGIIVKSNEKLEIGDVVSIYDNENDVNLGCFEISDMSASSTNRTKNVARKYKDCEECLESNKIICKDKYTSRIINILSRLKKIFK